MFTQLMTHLLTSRRCSRSCSIYNERLRFENIYNTRTSRKRFRIVIAHCMYLYSKVIWRQALRLLSRAETSIGWWAARMLFLLDRPFVDCAWLIKANDARVKLKKISTTAIQIVAPLRYKFGRRVGSTRSFKSRQSADQGVSYEHVLLNHSNDNSLIAKIILCLVTR